MADLEKMDRDKDILRKKKAHYKDKTRSTQWRKVRKEHIEKNNKCLWCGSTTALQVHHIVPFDVDPSKELEANNLITLCEKKGIGCHLMIGHLGNFKNWHRSVLEDCKHHKEEERD